MRHLPGRLLAFCVVTLLIAAFAPLVLIGGEAVNRRYHRGLRAGRIPRRMHYLPSPSRYQGAGVSWRRRRFGGLAWLFLTNPLWIALTAPARWVTDRLRPLAGGRRRRGNGPPGAGVREPRRPQPDLPAGAMALPEPDSFR